MEILNHHPAMGEVSDTAMDACDACHSEGQQIDACVSQVFLILREMMFDTLPVTLYMLFVATVAGVAYWAAMSPPTTIRNPHVQANHFGFSGFWAILG
jgi:hypothetical protein